MKKLLNTFLIAFVLACFSFVVGCNKETTLANKTEAKVTTAEKTSVKTSEKTNAKTDAPTTAHTHSFGDWTVIEDSTCIKKGSKERTCACGIKETEEIALKDHTLAHNDAVIGTDCEHKGTVEYYSCSVCSKNFSDQAATTELTSLEGEFGAHNYDYANGTWAWVEDTANGGYKAEYVYKCSVCENEVKATATVTSSSATATCLVKGDTTYTATVTVNEVEYTDTKVVEGELAAHVWNEGEVTTNPDCTNKGVKTFTCTVCETATKTEEVDALNHDYQDKVWYDHILDGYIENGKQCSRCTESKDKVSVYVNNYDLVAHINTTKPFSAGDSTSYVFDQTTKTVTINKMTASANQWCRFDFVRNADTTYKYAYVVVKGNTEGLCLGAKVDTNQVGSIANNKYDKTENNKQYKGIGTDTVIIVWDLEKLGIDSKELQKIVFWPYSKDTTTGSFAILGSGMFNTNSGTAKVEEHVYSTEWVKNAEGHAHACVCGTLKDSSTHTEENIPQVDATYDEGGKTAGKKCSVCGYIIEAQQDTPKLQYAITLELDGGTLTVGEQSITSMNVDKGTPASALSAYTPTKTGYTFTKWQMLNGENYVDIPTNATVTANLTIKAIFSAEKRTITFELDGGTLTVGEQSITSLEVDYNTPASELAGLTPTKTGCTFVKWQIVTKDGNIDVPANAVVQDNLTLIAVWNIEGNLIDYSVTTPSIMYGGASATNLPYPAGYGLYAGILNGGYEICYANGTTRSAISGFYGCTKVELTKSNLDNWVVSGKVSGIERKAWGGFGITFAWYNGAPIAVIITEGSFAVTIDSNENAKTFAYPADFTFTQTGKEYYLEVEVKLGTATIKCDGVTVGSFDLSTYENLTAACGVAMKNYASHTEELCIKEIAIPSHNIKFYDGDTELTNCAFNAYEGKEYTLVDGPEKDNYTFSGWYLNADFSGEKVLKVLSTNNQDVTLYAKYTQSKVNKEVASNTFTGKLDSYAVVAKDYKPYPKTNGMLFGIVNNGVEYVDGTGASRTTIPASNVAAFMPLTEDVSSSTKWTVKAKATGLVHGNKTAGGFGICFGYYVGKDSTETVDLMKPISAILQDDNFLYISYEGKIVGAKLQNANVTFSETGVYEFEISVNKGVVSVKVNGYEMALNTGSLDFSSLNIVPAVGPTCNNYNAHFENFSLVAEVEYKEPKIVELVDSSVTTAKTSAYAVMAADNGSNKPYPDAWGFKYSYVSGAYRFCDNSGAAKTLPANYYIGGFAPLTKDVSTITEWTSSITVKATDIVQVSGSNAQYCGVGITFGSINGSPLTAVLCQNGNIKISYTGNEYAKAITANASVQFSATGEYTFKVVVKNGQVTISINDITYATQDLSSLTFTAAVGAAQHNMNATYSDLSLTVVE